MQEIWYEQKLKEKHGRLEESEKWICKDKAIRLIVWGFFSAFIGQMFGLGGEFIYSPILMGHGAHPVSIASTCMYMIMFSATASTFMFVIYGYGPHRVIQFTLWLVVFATAGIMLGRIIMKRARMYYHRLSIVPFAFALAAFIGTALSAYDSVLLIRHDKLHDIDILHGSPIC